MRVQISTIMLGLLVSALGCATCGDSLSCCDGGFGCDVPVGCCIEESGCDSGVGCCEIIYDGPVYTAAPVAAPSCSTCNSGVATMAPPTTSAPTMVAPAMAAPANVEVVESQVSRDALPAAPSLDSIVRPSDNAVPAPEPTVVVPSNVTPKPASPTKPVKNVLPSIISDGT